MRALFRPLATLALVVSVAAAIGPARTFASDPGSSPVPASGTRVWQPADGVLGGAIPGVTVDLTAPIAWDGQFWATETSLVTSPVGTGDDDLTIWRYPGLWRSADGQHWTRSPLPQGMRGYLTIVVWQDRLTIVDDRHRASALRYVFWQRDDRRRWRTVRSLDVTGTDVPPGCSLENRFVATTPRRVAVTASCVPLIGAGGRTGASMATIRVAALSDDGPYPTYTWTSRDGRRWERHRVLLSTDVGEDANVFSLFQSVGRGIAAVTSDTDPRLLWSTDGRTFRLVSRIPMKTRYAFDVDAVLDEAGHPGTWLLATFVTRSEDPEIDADAAVKLMRLAPDGAWASAWVATSSLEDAFPTAGLSVHEHRVVAVIVRDPALVPRTMVLDTVASDDGGLTWTAWSEARSEAPCDVGLATLMNVAVQRCQNEWARVEWTLLDGAPGSRPGPRPTRLQRIRSGS